MITLSNFVVLGIIEVYALFISGLVVLVVYNHSLSQKITRLRNQLIKLKQNLKDKTGAKSPITKKKSFLDNEIESTSNKFSSIAPGQDITNYQENNIPEQIASLRYHFLSAEQGAIQSSNEEEKWASLQNSLLPIIDLLKASPEDKDRVEESRGDLERLKENWSELCVAALEMWKEKSTESEDNLMALFQVINSDLGFDQLKIPYRKPASEQSRQEYNKNVDAVNKLKHSADENKKLNMSLLDQKDAAESEVSIKTEALQRLQRFLNESEVCIKLLEDELEALRKPSEEPSEVKDLKNLVQNFAKESGEMLTCIETLEKENAELRMQLGSE